MCRSLRSLIQLTVLALWLDAASLTIRVRDDAVHSQRKSVSAQDRQTDGHTKTMTYFFPAYVGSWFVALQYIPSYVTSLESATALHQNGCASMRKSRTTPRVTLLSVNATGRPSPSARVRVA